MTRQSPAIQFTNVSKYFFLNQGRTVLSNRIASWLGEPHSDCRFVALKGVTFQVAKGEAVGIVGPNGAGKSTLLSLVSGIAEPDSGRVVVSGTVAPLLELGSGFHPDLTGVENLQLNASLLGFSKRRVKEMYTEIVEFAGIGDFIHRPLRTYSAGMVMRLAFSIAINMDPDILVIDEILAVGDAAYQEKSFGRILELHKAGKTLLIVSHSAGMIRQLCDRAIWLEKGQIKMDGKTCEVLETYLGVAKKT